MPYLYWEMIKYSKKIGKRYFDIGGFNVEAKKGEKTYQINKFKERFNGKLWAQPIYVTNSKYVIARRIVKRFKFVKRIIRSYASDEGFKEILFLDDSTGSFVKVPAGDLEKLVGTKIIAVMKDGLPRWSYKF